MLSGMLSARQTRSPRTPPFSLKKITAGSFSTAAVAARATVKPFFLGLCGFYFNVLLASNIVGLAPWHVEAHHHLIHVDDVSGSIL